MGSKAATDKDMQLVQPTSAGEEQIAAEQITPDMAEQITPDMKEYIGAKLHAIYTEVVNEPVPDRLIELMRKLEARDRKN